MRSYYWFLPHVPLGCSQPIDDAVAWRFVTLLVYAWVIEPVRCYVVNIVSCIPALLPYDATFILIMHPDFVGDPFVPFALQFWERFCYALFTG